jgi:hypothetical protein
MTDRPHEPDDPEAGRGSSRVILIGGRDLPDIRHSRGRPPAPPPPPGARPSRGLRPRPRLGGTLLLVVLLPLALLVAVPGWAMTKVDQVDAEPSGMRPADTPGSTYLLVGSDSREGLTPQERRQLHTGNASGSRTDTIMLLYAPTFTGQTLLISLPRDSIVDIPGYGPGHKLNAAFTYGGPELLVHTVENKTGLRIDNFVEVGIGGFRQRRRRGRRRAEPHRAPRSAPLQQDGHTPGPPGTPVTPHGPTAGREPAGPVPRPALNIPGQTLLRYARPPGP